jgi:hypothetical protein
MSENVGANPESPPAGTTEPTGTPHGKTRGGSSKSRASGQSKRGSAQKLGTSSKGKRPRANAASGRPKASPLDPEVADWFEKQGLLSDYKSMLKQVGPPTSGAGPTDGPLDPQFLSKSPRLEKEERRAAEERAKSGDREKRN